MDNRELCIQLVKAESEEEAIEILKKAGYWDDLSVWRNYGNDPGNASTISDQQSEAENAMVEKIVNSIDAVLMRECHLKGIDPEDSSRAPKNMREAAEAFFGVRRGAISGVDSSRRKELAESIYLVATGTKEHSCYFIIDKGEGQTPQDFPDTLVSLHRLNKVKIPFVQGKYNMGATGVLQFCGRHSLQLILSKRHPELAAKQTDDPTRNEWGCTIVRRFFPEPNMKLSVYKYLAPKGRVIAFNADSLPILPGQYPETYKESLQWGTAVKLYDYELTGRLHSNILMHFFFRISLLLAEMVLPVMVCERRLNFGGAGHEKVLAGLSVRLSDDPRETLEFKSSGNISVAGETASYLIYAFKKGKSESYKTSEGIVFLLNGQAHFCLAEDFFRRKSVEMSYLADSILVLVDCSDLSRRITEDLFMGSRDRPRKIAYMEEIERELEHEIRDHQGLRELRERRRREEAKAKLEDTKPVEEVLKKAIQRMPMIARLFEPGGKSGNPFKDRGVKEGEEWKGKRFPTYFRLVSDKKRTADSNRVQMKYETDAENDYFRRDDTPGRYSLILDDKEAATHRMYLWNGLATLTVSLPEYAKTGDVLRYTSRVWEEEREDTPVSEEQFEIVVGHIEEHPSGGKSSRTKPPGSDDGDKRRKDTGFIPPSVVKVYRDDWEMHGFDKFTALDVKHVSGNNYDYYVNMNNHYLEREIKERTHQTPDILRAQFMYALVIVGAAFLREDSEAFEKSEADKSREDEIRRITRGLAPTLMTMLYEIRGVIDDVA